MTVPEVRRLLCRLVWTPSLPGGFGVGLVSVETPTSGQSPALSLSTPPQTSGIICATVVLILQSHKH